MNEREKIIHLWFEMWLTKQDLGIDRAADRITRRGKSEVERKQIGNFT